jgi:serine protease AprX
MDRIVKLFCSGPEQASLASERKTLARYPGFLVIEAPKKALTALRRKYPVEDITHLYTINTGERVINTSRPRVDEKGKRHPHPAYRDVKRLRAGKHHYLVQFIGPIKDVWLRELRSIGAEPRQPYENFVYVVRATDRLLPKIASLPFVRWVGHLPHRARVAPALQPVLERGKKPRGLPRTRRLPDRYTVEFFGSDDRRAASGAVRKLGFKVLNPKAKGNVLIVEATGPESSHPRKLAKLSEVHGVHAIRARSLRRPSNDVAAGIMATARSLSNSGLGLSGKGETIAVCDTGLDTGDPSHIHPDFAGRVAWIKSYPVTPEFTDFVNNPGGNDGPADFDSGHGTHVVGSVLGNGAGSAGVPGVANPIRGLAYNAKLVFQAVEQELDWKSAADAQFYGRYLLAGIPEDMTVLLADAYRKRARIHSNSWGGGDPGEYDEQCEQLDRFVWRRRTFCVLVAAGNDGTDKDGDGKINPMSVTSPGTAKNCITVGACENLRTNFNGETYGEWWPNDYPVAPFRNDPMANNSDTVVAFSSRGSTFDGRVKPEVIAPGTFVLSTRSTQIAMNNTAWAAFPPSRLYFHMGGTSMATPLTAGAVALIREYLRTKQKMQSPSAALLKAALILGCQRLTGYSSAGALLDNHQGYGRVSLDAVLAPASPAKALFRDDKTGLRTGQVRTIMLKVKSNQAPLRVVLAYSDYPGDALVNNLNLILIDPNGKRYVGNQAAASGVMTLDATNNVEVIQVSQPAAGTWRAEIVGSNVPQGPQPFAWVAKAHCA